MTRLIAGRAEIADGYDALYCDLWGCLHDGVTAYAAAVAALRAFRDRGGAVILLTNAPRPAGSVERQLDRLGVPRDVWDAIVSSGDAGRRMAASGRFGTRVEHVGAPHDLSFFEGLPVEIAPPGRGEAVIVTGLRDDARETAADYRAEAEGWAARGLPMLCANPDLVVHRGPQTLACAGAIAALYEGLGGAVTYSGKPHAPIYALAAQALKASRGCEAARVLAIGDGIATDVAGAAAAGIDALFLTGGIAADEIPAPGGRPDRGALDAFLTRHGAAPAWTMARLA
jgi:HAD superfamily hydrolase (TIGR01459 family)